jgi:hypothetical protein
LIEGVGWWYSKVVPNIPLPVPVPREINRQCQGFEPALLPFGTIEAEIVTSLKILCARQVGPQLGKRKSPCTSQNKKRKTLMHEKVVKKKKR